MTARIPLCPRCCSVGVVKDSRIHNGKQNYRCKTCGRQLVEEPQNKIISQETKELIDKLLLEKLPLASIARVADVSKLWLKSSETCPNWLYDSPLVKAFAQSRLD